MSNLQKDRVLTHTGEVAFTADELIADPTIIALVYDNDGQLLDGTYNWESAQAYALNEGRVIKVIRGDGSYYDRERIQALCDAERERYRDCFGVEED